MKGLIVKTKLIPSLDAQIFTFDQMYKKYLRKCKKKVWATKEGFSLDFDSSLSDLVNCIFIFYRSKEQKEFIIKNYKVIEEIDYE